MAAEPAIPFQPGPTTAKIAFQHENKQHAFVTVGTIEWARYPTTLNNVNVQINDLRTAPEFKPTLDRNGFAKIEGLKPLSAALKEGDAKVLEDAYACTTETLKRECVISSPPG
jgi:hypothetical protein